MRLQSVAFMEKEEEECVDLLVSLGLGRPVSLVLVFVANVGETTSRDIERSTSLTQPVVSVVMQGLVEKHWLSVRASQQKTGGRPVKIYSLAVPFPEIIRDIEEEKKREARYLIQRAKKLQHYVSA